MTEHHNDPGPESSLTVHGLDHFSLAVSSVDTSRKWYQDWFGLKPVQTDPDVFMPYVSNGEVWVALLPTDEKDGFDKPVHQGPRATHVAFRTDGEAFQGYQERLDRERKEYDFLVHAEARSIYFKDPDGYVIEVTTHDRFL